MAEDGPIQNGEVVGEIDRKVYGALSEVPFYVVKLDDGATREVAKMDVFKAEDVVLEYRF